MEECYAKGKPRSSGKAVVGPFQVSEGQKRKALNIQTSMNLTFVFIPWFYLNSEVNPQKIQSKLFRAETALYRIYQISHVRSFLQITIPAIIVLTQPTCFPKIVAFLAVLDKLKTYSSRSFDFVQILTLQGLLCSYFQHFVITLRATK